MGRILNFLTMHAVLALSLLLGQSTWASDPAGKIESLNSYGDTAVNIEFYAEPLQGDRILAGEDFKVGFRIADSQSKDPLTHLHPAAWLTLQRPERGRPDKEACEREISALLRRGIIQAQPEADLNNFFILTLNVDNSIGIIDPTVNLNTANLLALIRFNGEAAEWALDEEAGMAFVTQPQEGRVVVVDLGRRTLKGYLETGAGARRIELPPDGQYVWVGNDGAGTVSVIDRETQAVVHTLQVGAGPLDLAVDDRDRFAFAGSGGEGHVSIIDVRQMKEVARVDVEKGEMTLAWSRQGRVLYAGNRKTGEVAVIDPERRIAVSRISLGLPLTSLKAAPDGRFLPALSSEQRKVKVIDAATNRVTGELPTEADPAHVLFSADYAYISHEGTPNISVVRLSGLENPEKAGVVQVPFGVTAPSQVKTLPGVNPMAVFPHGGHILGLNSADRTVFLYMEGMMVPMSSFKTFTDRPLGLLVYNQGLRESKDSGDYSALLRLEKAGVYNVPFYLESPLVATCFELAVLPNPDAPLKAQVKPKFVSLFSEKVFPPAETVTLHFSLVDEETGAPVPLLRDVVVLSFLQGSHWQHREIARHVADGLYEVEFFFPREGNYKVLVEAPSLGVAFGDLRHEMLSVGGTAAKP